MIYIFWTCADKSQAKHIIRGLLDKKLIACASMFPVESMYCWEGKVEESSEVKVLLKTLPKQFEAVQAYIDKGSSYEVSEVVQVDVRRGNPSYLDWLEQVVML